MSESKHSHLRLLFGHKETKKWHCFYFLLQLKFKKEYLQAGNQAGLPCWLLDLLNKSSELITTSSPSTSHTTPWVCTQTT